MKVYLFITEAGHSLHEMQVAVNKRSCSNSDQQLPAKSPRLDELHLDIQKNFRLLRHVSSSVTALDLKVDSLQNCVNSALPRPDEEFKIDLPLNSVEAVQNLESKLADPKVMRRLISQLSRHSNKELRQGVYGILAQLFTNFCGSLLTWTGKSKSKDEAKDSLLSVSPMIVKCIKGIIFSLIKLCSIFYQFFLL